LNESWRALGNGDLQNSIAQLSVDPLGVSSRWEVKSSLHAGRASFVDEIAAWSSSSSGSARDDELISEEFHFDTFSCHAWKIHLDDVVVSVFPDINSWFSHAGLISIRSAGLLLAISS